MTSREPSAPAAGALKQERRLAGTTSDRTSADRVGTWLFFRNAFVIAAPPSRAAKLITRRSEDAALDGIFRSVGLWLAVDDVSASRLRQRKNLCGAQPANLLSSLQISVGFRDFILPRLHFRVRLRIISLACMPGIPNNAYHCSGGDGPSDPTGRGRNFNTLHRRHSGKTRQTYTTSLHVSAGTREHAHGTIVHRPRSVGTIVKPMAANRFRRHLHGGCGQHSVRLDPVRS